MPKYFENLCKNLDNYPRTLLNCVIASEAIYEKDPYKVLNSDDYKTYNHTIKEIVVSKLDKNLQVKYMVCLCDVKQLIVAFGGTDMQKMADIIADASSLGTIVKHGKGQFHTGMFQRSEQIPVDFFIEKIVKEDYKVVFTGHSAGAALAGLVTNKVLKDKKMNGKQRNVLCLAFGPLAFADTDFKIYIEEVQNFKENFHFYVNEKDFVVEIMSLASNFIKKNLKKDMNLNEFVSLYKIGKISKILNILSGVKNIAVEVIIPNYKHFGYLFHITEKGLLRDYNTEVSAPPEDLVDDYFKNPNKIIVELKNHAIINYREKIINLLSSVIDTRSKNPLVINPFKGLNIQNIKCSITLVKNDLETDVCLNVDCYNVEYIIDAQLLYQSNVYAAKETTNQDTKAVILFSIGNRELYSVDKLKSIKNTFTLKSHFGNYEISINFTDTDVKKGLTHKEELIENMPVDLLYLHAIFYINTFRSLGDENSSFSTRCKDLKGILEDLNKIWNLDMHKRHCIKTSFLTDALSSYFINDWDNATENFDKFTDSVVKLDYDKYDHNMHSAIVESLPTCYLIKKELSTFFEWDRKISPLNNIVNIVTKFFYFPTKYSRPATDEGYIVTLKGFDVSFKDCMPYAGSYEREIFKQANLNKIQNSKILRTIKLNRQIRDLLSQGCIIGLVGQKKCGKSSFIDKFIPGANVKGNSNEATTKISIHNITESVVLIDYPHYEALDFTYKSQLILSNKLLDHRFLICNAVSTEKNDIKELFNLVKSKEYSRLTILLNKVDKMWEDRYEKNEFELKIKNIKKIFCEIWKLTSEKEKDIIILTSLIETNGKDINCIQKTNVLMGDELKETIYKIILDKIPEENESVRTTFISKMLKNLKVNKKIKIKKGKGVSPLLVIVSKNKDLYEEKADDDEYMIIDSFNELVKELTCVNTPHPSIRLFSDQDIIMSSIDDFLSVEGHVFIVTSL
jgi:hypothetical protein